MSTSRLGLVLLLLGPSAASATPMRGAAQEGQQGARVDVVVHNRVNTDARVYVLHAGHMVPIGFVKAGADATLAVPAILDPTGEFRLVADPIGSTDWHTSDQVAVRPGHDIDFTIARGGDRVVVRE